jgi:hypothetical protein
MRTTTRQPRADPQRICRQNSSIQPITNDALRTADPNIIFHRDKRLIPTCREPGDQLLNELQLVHHLREVVAGLGGLAKGEALGIEVIRHALIINRAVVNNRYTVSPPKLRADVAETGGPRPALRPGLGLGKLGEQPRR